VYLLSRKYGSLDVLEPYGLYLSPEIHYRNINHKMLMDTAFGLPAELPSLNEDWILRKI
jgi:hypothetical protein